VPPDRSQPFRSSRGRSEPIRSSCTTATSASQQRSTRSSGLKASRSGLGDISDQTPGPIAAVGGGDDEHRVVNPGDKLMEIVLGTYLVTLRVQLGSIERTMLGAPCNAQNGGGRSR
jgi:hypothetical protein